QEAGEEGDPVTRIAPRALVIPPGFPDFMSRSRIVRPGPVMLEGRAWSGRSPVERVEVSVDSGLSWMDTELEPSEHRWAWRRWRREGGGTRGDCVVTARAVTADGEAQPVDPAWNRGGFANNGAQQVPVACLP